MTPPMDDMQREDASERLGAASLINSMRWEDKRSSVLNHPYL